MMDLVVVTWEGQEIFLILLDAGDFPFLQTEKENKGYGRYIKTKYYILYWFDQDNSQTNEMKGFLVYFMLSRKLESEEVVVNVVFLFPL